MELWTLGELAERVEAALADYPGQANGRVRPVPDQRTIRWYTTTGLVDRPAEMRGRTALYNRRHLLQLVAIKRRQSQGRTIAQIQSELAGATTQSLEPIAALPTPLPPTPQKTEATRPAPHAASDAAAEPGTAPGPGAAPAEPDASAPASRPALPRARFWADRSPEPTPTDVAPGDAPRLAASARELSATSGAIAPGIAVVSAVRIAGGVTVVLDQGGVVVDAERLAVAAGPFVAELRRQGLLSRSSGDES
ncbi:MerR family transcriptional regulator [Kribbella sp. NPDC051718]|uniref:MerR family transcriptional regulator n=1 Tax=Kribbella sp. NPDC051718 TaxID=3155168 RepID=UPI00341DE7A0